MSVAMMIRLIRCAVMSALCRSHRSVSKPGITQQHVQLICLVELCSSALAISVSHQKLMFRLLPCAGLELSSADASGQQPGSDRRWTQFAQLIPDLRASSGQLPQQDIQAQQSPLQEAHRPAVKDDHSPQSRRASARSWGSGIDGQHTASPSAVAHHLGAPLCHMLHLCVTS